MHGGLQRTTRQGLRFLAASPEDYQHILNKGKGRLQRALDWLEFHESSTIFTAFDYVKKADDTVHQARRSPESTADSAALIGCCSDST